MIRKKERKGKPSENVKVKMLFLKSKKKSFKVHKKEKMIIVMLMMMVDDSC